MNIFLLPFLNSFILHLLLEEGQLFNKPYKWFQRTVMPRIKIPNSVLGGCVTCTSFWMGVIAFLILKTDLFDIEHSFLLLEYITYNAVLTTILYKFLHERG